MSDKMLYKVESDQSLKEWREKEKCALEILGLTGDLRYDRGVEIVMFRKDVFDRRPSEFINEHHTNAHNFHVNLQLEDSLAFVKYIHDLPAIPPCKIDIGKLGLEWNEQKSNFANIQEFTHFQLRDIISGDTPPIQSKDVVLYGFGRIGRIAARRITELTGRGDQLRLRAIVIRQSMPTAIEEAGKRASLLEYDSVHGPFGGNIEVTEDGKELIINGNRVHLIHAANPKDINYEDYGIHDALLIDNTGVWKEKATLSQHLRPGISQVLFTAPGKDIPNIVYGVNHESFDYKKENVFCAASCTTNAIVPVIKVIDDAFGIEKGHIETVHAYTSDQNLLDNFHKKPRRGRAAAMNMVITSTGAAKAVAKVLPYLDGKMTGNAVRVPVPDGSLAIINLHITSVVTKELVNQLLQNASLHGPLVEQIFYSASDEFASNNVVGTTASCVVDGPSTLVSKDGKSITLYAWYDNEYGYTCQVVRLAKYAAKVRRPAYY